MPRYRIANQTVRRKNFYLPCVIAAEVDDMSDEEYVRTLKETYWADNITNAEWPAVLGHEDCSPSAKSRLKKKGAGWFMALGRIAYLNPALYNEMVKAAEKMYRDQIGGPHPCFNAEDNHNGTMDSTDEEA